MREIARVSQGFFPTQDRIVTVVASLFRLTSTGSIVVLDAGCGIGKAIYDLRRHWHKRQPDADIPLLGIESDKSRHQQASDVLGPNNLLWSAIEDATVDQPVSLLWYNPPYDRIRGAGRTESTLFNRVKDWPARGTGLLLMIVPDYVLAAPDVSLAVAIERDYELLGLWRYAGDECLNRFPQTAPRIPRAAATQHTLSTVFKTCAGGPMPLARDLNELIHRYGGAIANRA